MMVGAGIEETGRLLRDGAGFLFQRDLGGAFRLVLHRVPVDHIEKRVCITGHYAGDGVVDVEGVRPA